MSGGLLFSLSFVEHLSCLIIWPELTQDVQGSSACPLLPQITKNLHSYSPTLNLVPFFLWSGYNSHVLDVVWFDWAISYCLGICCWVMCSRLQQNQRTFKWPNANDLEAAEQSQDWTLDCTLLSLSTGCLSWRKNLICHQNTTAAVWKWCVFMCVFSIFFSAHVFSIIYFVVV